MYDKHQILGQKLDGSLLSVTNAQLVQNCYPKSIKKHSFGYIDNLCPYYFHLYNILKFSIKFEFTDTIIQL